MNTSHCVCHFHTAGTYGRDGVNELLSMNGVDMSTSLCLQGGGAVPALAPLSPWFGPGVSIKDGRLCATGLSLTYTPLKVRTAVVLLPSFPLLSFPLLLLFCPVCW